MMTPHTGSWGVVVMAAGKGTRMRSDTPKVLHRLAGRPLIDHVVEVALTVTSPQRVAVVVGHQADRVRTHLARQKVMTPLQEPQQGTGHALEVGLGALEPAPNAILVLSGDVPLLRTETVTELIAAVEAGASAAVLTAVLATPGRYGRIIRGDDGALERIVEASDATAEELTVAEVNAGVYAFATAPLTSALAAISPTNAQGEYYLTDVIERFRRDRLPLAAVTLADGREMLGVNSRQDLAAVARVLNQRQLDALMASGVTIVDPTTTWVDPGCQVGRDTVIEPGVVIRGAAHIGRAAIIGASCVIDGARIDDSAVIPPLTHLEG